MCHFMILAWLSMDWNPIGSPVWQRLRACRWRWSTRRWCTSFWSTVAPSSWVPWASPWMNLSAVAHSVSECRGPWRGKVQRNFGFFILIFNKFLKSATYWGKHRSVHIDSFYVIITILSYLIDTEWARATALLQQFRKISAGTRTHDPLGSKASVSPLEHCLPCNRWARLQWPALFREPWDPRPGRSSSGSSRSRPWGWCTTWTCNSSRAGRRTWRGRAEAWSSGPASRRTRWSAWTWNGWTASRRRRGSRSWQPWKGKYS